MDTETLRGVSSGDEYVAPQSQRWGKVALAVGAACALLVVGFATGSHFVSPQASQAVTSSVVAPLQLNQIAVVPPREECAKVGKNCIAQKCCKVTGYECYEVKPGMAQCMKECIPGKDGTCLHHSQPMKASEKSDISYSANTLFCFSFYTEETGTTKKSYELDLLRTQLFLGASIFGCEAWRVYSDVETWLSPNKFNTVKVDDVNNDFHFQKRKKTGTWINSNIFIAAWKAIKDEGVWAGKDWTVKVDADAVFLPERLRQYVGQVEVTKNGVYFENCKYVSYGFFGSLEVLSHNAAGTFMANLDECKTSLNYMGSEKLTGYEPWGEDLFAQRCMDLHGVDKISAFDVTTDAACAAWRPEGQKKNLKWKPDCATTLTPAIHPFKKPKEYFDCLKATQR
jgi:hypothetical protein